jgi:hypothetical protein
LVDLNKNYVMKERIKLFLLIFVITVSERINGQDNQFSLKVGAAKFLQAPASSSSGFAYKTLAPSSPYPTLHFEYKRENFFKKRISLLAGISGIPTFGEITLNEKNIKSGYSRSARYSYYSLQLYGGAEISFKKLQKPPYKNYFSIFATAALNLSAGEELKPVMLSDGGVTNNGEVFSGTKYTVEQGRFLSPSVQAGLRYHITNSKGKDVIILELMMNYNLRQYFAYTFRYQINGVDRVDYVPEKGFSIQFNVIIPLFRTEKK